MGVEVTVSVTVMVSVAVKVLVNMAVKVLVNVAVNTTVLVTVLEGVLVNVAVCAEANAGTIQNKTRTNIDQTMLFTEGFINLFPVFDNRDCIFISLV